MKLETKIAGLTQRCEAYEVEVAALAEIARPVHDKLLRDLQRQVQQATAGWTTRCFWIADETDLGEDGEDCSDDSLAGALQSLFNVRDCGTVPKDLTIHMVGTCLTYSSPRVPEPVRATIKLQAPVQLPTLRALYYYAQRGEFETYVQHQETHAQHAALCAFVPDNIFIKY